MKSHTNKQDYTLLWFSQLALAFPEQQMVGVEPAAVVKKNSPGDFPFLGAVSYLSQRWLLAALSPQLTPLPEMPRKYQFWAYINEDDTRLAIGCDVVGKITSNKTYSITKIPEPMKLTHTPFDSILYYENRIVLVLRAGPLFKWIYGWGSNHVEL